MSKFHFLSKKYKILKSFENSQFLFLCQYWRFLAVKIRNIWIFAPKLVKHCRFMVLFGPILSQNRDFWPKSSNIWYTLESKIQKHYWILAQKFKLDFVKIKFWTQKYDFWQSVRSELQFLFLFETIFLSNTWIFAPKTTL